MDESISGTDSASGISEDWLAVWIGLGFFLLALIGLAGPDLLGWAVTTAVWTDIGTALAPISESYSALGGVGALIVTYVVLLAVVTASAAALKLDIKHFAAAFSVVFWLAYLSWIVGSYAHLAVTTPAEQERFGISWSLRLTNEGGYVVALIVGLIISNAFPRFADWLRPAIRSELYIKTAIVILGAFLAVSAAERLSLATTVLWRGFAAIIEAYLIYWAVVYYVTRRWFGFSREWAVPLASGISICGVSAAIATGGAIRARPLVPVVVSSLVVIFAVVELLVLPFAAQAFLAHEPLVAGSWLGLAVKTDGAAVASGTIAESLILAKSAAQGINYEAGWILGAATTVKVFIDIFIGIWAFVLAYIWTNHVDVRPGDKARGREIWQRFPKFILGYVVTFAATLAIALGVSPEVKAELKSVVSEANVFRGVFFTLTFFSIGVAANFRRLWQEGIGKLAAVYVVCLFGFIIWAGLLISWVFFSGIKPPLASG
ncbi:MAG TPA: putative sulfate exporter family transporter [Gammaproteobacteria bacterium]